MTAKGIYIIYDRERERYYNPDSPNAWIGNIFLAKRYNCIQDILPTFDQLREAYPLAVVVVHKQEPHYE